jgi:hypothetical protein
MNRREFHASVAGLAISAVVPKFLLADADPVKSASGVGCDIVLASKCAVGQSLWGARFIRMGTISVGHLPQHVLRALPYAPGDDHQGGVLLERWTKLHRSDQRFIPFGSLHCSDPDYSYQGKTRSHAKYSRDNFYWWFGRHGWITEHCDQFVLNETFVAMYKTPENAVRRMVESAREYENDPVWDFYPALADQCEKEVVPSCWPMGQFNPRK